MSTDKPQFTFTHHLWHDAAAERRIVAAKRKRARRIERNMRNEYRQGRGPEELTLMKDGTWTATCKGCGLKYTLCYDAVDFHPDVNVCGGSRFCMP